MARKQRNNVDYFPHPVSHGKKMFYLRTKFGNDGYTVWFMLLEHLGNAEYHYLDLSDKIQLMYLSSEFMVSEIVLSEIINILVEFGDFDAELWNENKILFNERFVENIEDAYKKRGNECITKKSLLDLLTAKGIRKSSKSIPNEHLSSLKVSDNTQSKVKEIKVNEIKLNKTKEKEKLFIDSDCFDLGFLIEKLEQSELPYSQANAEYYYNAMKNWSDENGKKKVNWLATCKNWILRDFKEGKLIDKNYKIKPHGKSNYPNTSYHNGTTPYDNM